MTAASFDQADGDPARAARCAADAVIARIGLTCRTAADGRRAARALAEWAYRFKLGEPDLQVLWSLRAPANEGLDQTTLARHLAYSPAQVSATVERMRAAGWIVQQQAPGDRRRHLWQLSDNGRQLLNDMLTAAGYLRCDADGSNELSSAERHQREAAA